MFTSAIFVVRILNLFSLRRNSDQQRIAQKLGERCFCLLDKIWENALSCVSLCCVIFAHDTPVLSVRFLKVMMFITKAASR